MATREELLERAKLIQKAREIQARNSAPADNALLDAPDVEKSALQYAAEGAGAVGKALDVGRAATGGPLVGALIEMISGKKVYDQNDIYNAANPTNLKTFPTTSEMLERAGVPAGAQLSDYIPYGKPGSPWFVPEEGGALDPSIRGGVGTAVDIASDPLTWLTGGASAATKQAIAKSATSQAMKGAPKASGRIANALAKMGGAVNDTTLGRAALSTVSFPSKAIKKVGEYAYGIPVRGVEHEGEKFGKKAIADVLYQGGVKSPFNLEEKAGDIADKLLTSRNKVLIDARKAEVDATQALKPVYSHVNKLLLSEDEATRQLAKRAKKRLDAMSRSGGVREAEEVVGSLPRSMEMGGGHSPVEFLPETTEIGSLPRQGTMAGGSSAVDFVPEEEILGSLPRSGDWKYGPTDSQQIFSQKPALPTMETRPGRAVPGKTTADEFTQLPEEVFIDTQPGRVVPGKPVNDELIEMKPLATISMTERKPGWTPKQTASATTRLANRLSRNDYMDDVIRNEAKKIDNMSAAALRNANVEAVAKELGAQSGADLKELNQNLGKMLSTKRSQEAVARQTDRTLDQAVNPLSGTNRLASAMFGPEATLTNMALRGASLLTMPAAYGARKFAESPIMSTAADSYLRTKFKQQTSEPNQWEKVKKKKSEE